VAVLTNNFGGVKTIYSKFFYLIIVTNKMKMNP